ncbi:MAG: type II secretion system protein [Opitutaceae bacterium]
MPTYPAASLKNNKRAAFSLVEMIGVLAIIAILAVVIVPKVFSTIASSRVTNALASVNSVKSAVTEFVGKHGTVPTTNNNARIDDLLFSEQFLESRFAVKIGTQPATTLAGATWSRSSGNWTSSGGSSQTSQSRIICLTSNTTTPVTANGRNFQLDGANNLPAGSRVISAVLVNVRGSEAQELSLRIDGEPMSQGDIITADAAGRVVYRAPNSSGLATAYVYLAHQ